jgi:dihydroflavonol-4-reductase
MKVAVTGASGHIGINLCRALVNRGHATKVLVHKNTENLKDFHLEQIQGDLKDADSLATLVRDADIVFHLGAMISIRGNRTGELFDINVEGTRRICEAAQKASVKRFIHFSSIHALVHAPYDQVLDENRPLAVADKMAYSRSKAKAEEIVLDAARKELDAVILSPTAVIGPFDYAPSLMGRALILLAHGKLPALVPGGYDWVDVRDVVKASIAAIEKGKKGERYLLSGHWMTLKQISDLVSRLIDFRPKKFTCPHWLAQIGLPFINLYCSVSEKEPLYTRDSLYTLRTSHKNISHIKASQELGFNPRPFEETLQDTLDWFQNRGFLR